MADAFVITISIAFSVFLITTVVVLIMRKKKAKQNVGVVYSASVPGPQQYPPAYGQHSVYAPGHHPQPPTGYPYAPGHPPQGYPAHPGYPPHPGYQVQPGYPAQSGFQSGVNQQQHM